MSMVHHHWTRRSLLGGLGGAAAAGALPARAAAFARPAVDVHHHYLPPDYKPLARPWLDRYATGVAGVLAWTPERSLEQMALAGIGHAVLSISAPGLFFGDPAQAGAVARACNDYAAALVRSHPGKFSFFAALPMPDVEGSIREAERALTLPGARGVGLLTNYDGRYLGEAAFRPFFDWLGRHPSLAFIHPTTAPCCTGLTPDVPTPMIEFPMDTGRTIASMLWGGVLSAYPQTRFLFSHGGGVLPMVLERIAAAGMIRPEVGRRVPEGMAAALSRIFVDTASVTVAPAMAAVQAWLPPSQILYGTDYPWGDPARARTRLEALGLAADRIAAIERDNAVRIGLGA